MTAQQLTLFPAVEPPCAKCKGTGIYLFGGTLNGVARKSGICFHCRGKGFMTTADMTRTNNYFDFFYLSRA